MTSPRCGICHKDAFTCGHTEKDYEEIRDQEAKLRELFPTTVPKEFTVTLEDANEFLICLGNGGISAEDFDQQAVETMRWSLEQFLRVWIDENKHQLD
jgi:hypothetical protein